MPSSESCTRFLVEVEPGKKFNLQTKMMGVPCIPLGRISKLSRLKVKDVHGTDCLEVTVDALREAFQGGFQG